MRFTVNKEKKMIVKDYSDSKLVITHRRILESPASHRTPKIQARVDAHLCAIEAEAAHRGVNLADPMPNGQLYHDGLFGSSY